ncbi:MAG: sigma-70 family RNA polymerase sigma factor [Firmicutes bacterium]|nr:sigma-70 family RNA polymerase sigma factor [Bacillota bacterium]
MGWIYLLVRHDSDEARVNLLRELMDAHGNDVLRVVYGIVRDRQIAEDLSQEVFVKVYDHLPEFRQESSYKTWILRIAVNRAKDYLRSAARRSVPVDDLTYLTQDETAEQAALAHLDQQDLWKAVLALPDTYRETMWLYYSQELQVDEIASVIGVSVSSVKTRLHRGRELLRRAWGRDD